MCCFLFFFNDTATTEIYTLSLHDALPISPAGSRLAGDVRVVRGDGGNELHELFRHHDGRHGVGAVEIARRAELRSEEHTSELQSRLHLVCRLLLEKKKKHHSDTNNQHSTS